MAQGLNSRRATVLRALVREYIASVQPVSSKALVDRYDLGCSSATVRNELAALEETGYVYQPHVSAGRIPTDTGYRAFVDGVAGSAALPAEETDAIHERYAALAREMVDVLRETPALLSALTNYVAVVAAPRLRRARIRRVSVVPLAPRRALVVVVTDSGQVADRQVDFGPEAGAALLAEVERAVNALLDGMMGDDVERLRDGVAADAGPLAAVMSRVLVEVVDCLGETDDDRVVTGGVSALLAQPEFAEPAAVRPLLDLLEDGLSVLGAISESLSQESMTVRIGTENRTGALKRVSFVASRYGDGDTGGVVGVIGPTRMDYPRVMASVRVVSDALSEVLG